MDLDDRAGSSSPPAATNSPPRSTTNPPHPIRRGDLDELRSRADQGDEYAARLLADREVRSVAADGDLDALRALASTNWQAAAALVDLLAARGDIQALQDMADEVVATPPRKRLSCWLRQGTKPCYVTSSIVATSPLPNGWLTC